MNYLVVLNVYAMTFIRQTFILRTWWTLLYFMYLVNCVVIILFLRKWIWKILPFNEMQCSACAVFGIKNIRPDNQLSSLSLPAVFILAPSALVARSCNIGNNNFSESLSRGDYDRWTMRRGQCQGSRYPVREPGQRL